MSRPHPGERVQTPWSSEVYVKEVLYTVQIASITFHGIKVIDRQSWTFDKESLLWVAQDGEALKTWTEYGTQPVEVNGQLEWEVDRVIGHHRARSGELFYAVKWVGYNCPTWELEERLDNCIEAIIDYWSKQV